MNNKFIAAYTLVVMTLVLSICYGNISSHISFASAQLQNNTENLPSGSFLDENTTLGEPFFVEKGKIIGQRVINVNPDLS